MHGVGMVGLVGAGLVTPGQALTGGGILVADVGGTHTRLGWLQDGYLNATSVVQFANDSHEGFVALVREFTKEPIQQVIVAVAGPLLDGAAQLTNRDWHFEPGALQSELGAERVWLLNDLQAQGYGLADLPAGTRRRLGVQPLPEPAESDTCLIVGCGTGLNAAVVNRESGKARVRASECGHVTLALQHVPAPRLLEWARAQPHVSAEDLLSGPGLGRLHAVLLGEQTPWSSVDVLAWGRRDSAEVQQTLRTFVALLAQFCADLALVHLPFGGVYLTGGFMQVLAPLLPEYGFVESFAGPNRGQEAMRDLLQRMPLGWCADDAAALYGCAGFWRAIV